VEDLLQRLRTASRVAVVGNGGIALELIHEVCSAALFYVSIQKNQTILLPLHLFAHSQFLFLTHRSWYPLLQLRFCEVDWIVKDNYIGSAFFDASASAFILPSLHARASVEHGKDAAMAIVESGAESAAGTPLRQDCVSALSCAVSSGSALGPEWISKTAAKAFLQERKHLAGAGRLKVRTCCAHWFLLNVPPDIYSDAIPPCRLASLAAGGAGHQHGRRGNMGAYNGEQLVPN
jgi:hypothetical protein